MDPRSERGSGSGNNLAVESAVTRLLVSIKALLESLTKWSEQEITDMDVSDVYMQLGNDFNAAVAAFAAYNIEMKELHTVPEDLRNILETCLAEDARPENLQRYLPDVRKVITNLLQGLRGKQTIYRKIISDQKHRSDASGHSRHESRSPVRSSHRDTASSQKSLHRNNLDAPRVSGSSPRTITSSRRGPSVHGIDSPPRLPLIVGSDDSGFVGGFVKPRPPPFFRELQSIPEDLRNIQETCLLENALPENLQCCLPGVRGFIRNLLQGLRGKQTIHRKTISEQKHRSDASGHSRHES